MFVEAVELAVRDDGEGSSHQHAGGRDVEEGIAALQDLLAFDRVERGVQTEADDALGAGGALDGEEAAAVEVEPVDAGDVDPLRMGGGDGPVRCPRPRSKGLS